MPVPIDPHRCRSGAAADIWVWGAITNLMTRLGLARLLARLHALLLHLVGIVLRVILLATHHMRLHLPLLPRHAHLLLLPGHAMDSLLRQLRTHAHLIWSPASDSIAHVIYKAFG